MWLISSHITKSIAKLALLSVLASFSWLVLSPYFFHGNGSITCLFTIFHLYWNVGAAIRSNGCVDLVMK